jgi:N-acetylmuramoyl-L-alanine amidase
MSRVVAAAGPAWWDRAVMALTVWREARGESYAAKIGMAWVIRNRSEDAGKRWHRSIAEVCLQPLQFSCYNPTDPNAVKMPRLKDLSFVECLSAVVEVMKAEAVDPTRGANHYHALAPGKEPAWADESKLTAIIGRTRFYRL